MHEVLAHLPADAVVLDLGCAGGSFAGSSTKATVVRIDRAVPSQGSGEFRVRGDAASLPFRAGTFHAIVANHSLEHFDQLENCLGEIGRVIRPDGSLFISVPDASTFTDRLYRWLARGGGHVNAFVDEDRMAAMISRVTGLPHVATRTLCSSLSFLNRHNAPKPQPRSLRFLGGGSEWSLLLYTWVSRRLDRIFGSRTSVYGWAFYFGRIPTAISTVTSKNVCIRCGSSTPAVLLAGAKRIRRKWLFRVYSCPNCGATNSFSRDSDLGQVTLS